MNSPVLTKKKTTKKRRLVQGRDYHGWAWKAESDDRLNGLFFWAEPHKPRPDVHAEVYSPVKPSEKGKWVRVKFVEAKS